MSNVQSLIDTYSRLLGVDGQNYPTSFDEKHVDAFNVFLKEFSLKTDVDRNALFLALEFIRYMKSIGIGVLKKVPTMVKMRETNITRFSPQAVYEQLLIASLKDTATEVMTVIRQTHLFDNTKVVSSKMIVNGVRDMTLVHHIEIGEKKEALQSVLHKLQGALYSSSDIPIQLREQYTKVPAHSKLSSKIVTPTVGQRIANSSALGWFCLRKTSDFAVYVTRARGNKLVLRIAVPIMPVTLGFVVANTVKSIVPKYWARIFKEYV